MPLARHLRSSAAARGATLASNRLPAFNSRVSKDFDNLAGAAKKRTAAAESGNLAAQWKHVGPPLRPSVPDLNFYLNAINQWTTEHGIPRGLILGVTPELWRLPWPQGSDVLAADRNHAMIDAIWPGPRNAIVCADWTSLPFAPASRDIVVCDGGLQVLSYPEEHQRFVRELQRIVVPNGLCIFRMFEPAEPSESPDDVLADLLSGKIANVNFLKIRLAMALAKGPGHCVRLRQVWEALRDAAPDFATLADRIGWPLEHLRAIDAYRDRHARFHLLSVDDVRELFCQSRGGFAIERIDHSNYELGERCPTIVLRRSR